MDDVVPSWEVYLLVGEKQSASLDVWELYSAINSASGSLPIDTKQSCRLASHTLFVSVSIHSERLGLNSIGSIFSQSLRALEWSPESAESIFSPFLIQLSQFYIPNVRLTATHGSCLFMPRQFPSLYSPVESPLGIPLKVVFLLIDPTWYRLWPQ